MYILNRHHHRQHHYQHHHHHHLIVQSFHGNLFWNKLFEKHLVGTEWSGNRNAHTVLIEILFTLFVLVVAETFGN
jgi:hypothetical protein